MDEKKIENLNLEPNGGYPMHTFDDIKSVFELYISNPDDKKKIEDAYNFIMDKHKDQVRKSGEPYYHHLLEVCYILATLQAGPSTLISGLLHDVVEDTNTTIEEIRDKWGDDVAKIVDSLTKIQRLKLSKLDAEEFEDEDHRKIFLGMAKDVRVIIVKLADRLHNMRTLGALSKERQIALSRETLNVFVPISHRLGINIVKSEMEDLCLKYLEPEKYDLILKKINKKKQTMEKSLEALTKRIADMLFENHIPFDIKNRIKSIYSIYEKIYHKGRSFEEIYDIMAMRIITDTEIQCYEILGLIHKTYKPIPGRFKDYIAMPKPNMYQSLHTAILSGDGNRYEIQIRTKAMDEVAESGVAAHWGYKEGKYNAQKEQKEIENQLHWFRDFVSMSQEEKESASEYMESLTSDIFGANVYVFTPKGKVLELPSGSTPLDFAYRIHTKVAESAVGAIINGVMVPLNTPLNTGDIVEIKTSKNPPGPNEKWLEWVASSNARANIKKYLLKKNATFMREENISKAKSACLDAFRDRDINGENEVIEYLRKPDLLNHFGYETYEDLMLGVAIRNPSPSQILDYLGIYKATPEYSEEKHIDDGTSVYCKGAGRIAISLASCCTPIPGDSIIGYITKGKGITVHRTDCPNIANEKFRLIDVYWKEGLDNKSYPVDIHIEASNRSNLLSDILNALTSVKVSFTSIHAKTNTKTLTDIINMTIYVNNYKKLMDVFAIINGVKGVISVARATH